MIKLDPKIPFRLLAGHLPDELHKHVLVVGSLAAAYEYRDRIEAHSVNTKDADIVVQPARAIQECVRIAQRLLDDGWRRRDNCYPHPEPSQNVRAIRLMPPESDAYFIELLALPRAGQTLMREWIPVRLTDGWYGLPSFRYMAVVGMDQKMSTEKIAYASPAMMALANLLHHPTVAPALMSEPIGDRRLRRSVKDLARVLGLAFLAERDELQRWAPKWRRALAELFPNEAAHLSAHLGDGLKELIGDESNLREAQHALNFSILAGKGLTTENLRLIGEQVLLFAVEKVR